MSIAPHDAAQVAATVIGALDRTRSKGANAHELVAGREIRPLRAGNEFPAALGKEPVVAASDELGAILERHAESRLYDAPVREHARFHIAAIPAIALGAINGVAYFELCDSSCCAVRHEYRRVARDTVDAAVLASPIRVDRRAEPHVRRVVVREDGARALDGDLRLERPLVLFVRRPAVVERLARDRLEAPLEERARAAHEGDFALAVLRHRRGPYNRPDGDCTPDTV